jgi:hypothetical protein
MGQAKERQSAITKALFLVAAGVTVAVLTTSCHTQNGDNTNANNPTNIPCSESATGNVEGDCPDSSGAIDKNSNSNTSDITVTPLAPPVPLASPTPPASPGGMN